MIISCFKTKFCLTGLTIILVLLGGIYRPDICSIFMVVCEKWLISFVIFWNLELAVNQPMCHNFEQKNIFHSKIKWQFVVWMSYFGLYKRESYYNTSILIVGTFLPSFLLNSRSENEQIAYSTSLLHKTNCNFFLIMHSKGVYFRFSSMQSRKNQTLCSHNIIIICKTIFFSCN